MQAHWRSAHQPVPAQPARDAIGERHEALVGGLEVLGGRDGLVNERRLAVDT